MHHQLRLNFMAMPGHEFPQLLLATLLQSVAERRIVSRRGRVVGVRISRELHDMLRHQFGAIVLSHR